MLIAARFMTILSQVYEWGSYHARRTPVAVRDCARGLQGAARGRFLSRPFRPAENPDRAREDAGIADQWLCLLPRGAQQRRAQGRRDRGAALSAQRLARGAAIF